MNSWFDRVPRQWIDIGARRVPAFRSMGVVGFQISVVLAVLSGLRSGVSLTSTLGICAAAAASFFAWAFLRRAVTGVESLVLLEHVWVAFGLVGAYLWAADVDSAVGFDVLSTSLPVFLAFGRIGCLVVGCCHGTPAPIGVRYHSADHVPPRLIGRRLRPVPLYEAMGLVAIAVVSLWLIGGTPGRSTVWFLAAYAALRFGTEALRGDRRPHLGLVSVPRIMCGAQLVAALVASESWLVAGNPDRGYWITVGLLAVAAASGWSLSAVRSNADLGNPEHLDEIWELLKEASTHDAAGDGTHPTMHETARAVTVGVSVLQESHLHVSLSHPTATTVALGRALIDGPVLDRASITHFWIDLAKPQEHDHENEHDRDRDQMVTDEDASSDGSVQAATGDAHLSDYFTRGAVPDQR